MKNKIGKNNRNRLKFLGVIFSLIFATSGLCDMKRTYDENGVRYTLVTDTGNRELNWLFLPGGPGADSRYLLSLTKILNLPGKVWLIDFPGNGDNSTPDDYDFHHWLNLLPTIASRFSNCVIIGHSLGGMLPLLSPELEEKLLGLIIINSAPSLWTTESARLFKKHRIPTLPEKEAFSKNKTQENYNKLLKAYIPYYFNKDAVSKGRELFQDLPFPIKTTLTVFTIMQEINYNARWVPQKIATLIIGGDQDYINPFSLFENDSRFDRQNIQKILIKGCGHWCWLEKPKEIHQLISRFSEKHILSKINKTLK